MQPHRGRDGTISLIRWRRTYGSLEWRRLRSPGHPYTRKHARTTFREAETHAGLAVRAALRKLVLNLGRLCIEYTLPVNSFDQKEDE